MHDNPITIVLAEDDDFFMNPLTWALEDEGYHVVPAENIESLKQEAGKAHVLVVDARMSDTHPAGVACAAELVASGVISTKVPLIFISVLSVYDDFCQQEIRKHPVLTSRFMWLQKYFETDLLLETIRDEIKKRASL